MISKPRILACTPSYALYMADEAREMGLDPRDSSWEIGIFGAEPWSESMRKEIEATWNMLATDVYGLSEIIGPEWPRSVSIKHASIYGGMSSIRKWSIQKRVR